MGGFAACALVACGTSVAAAEAIGWSSIVVPRFGTRAEIPTSIFIHQRDPDNGDGVTLKATDGARLLIYGSWYDEDGRTPTQRWVWLRRAEPLRYAHVNYLRTGKDFLVVSGTIGATEFYERYRFDDPSGARHALIFEYPKGKIAKYRPLVSRISASLSFSRPMQ
ncbi:MAG: hypothetical protein ABJA20_03020 [Novosphingobium sp.]